MSAPHDAVPEQAPECADRDATRYDATPPVDPAATRYSDPPAIDPAATRYSDTPAVETTNAPGRLPRRFGGYELLAKLGEGGMGVVYKARQFTPERLVALKVIRSGQLATDEDVRLFRQEANEAARLDHPNIVPVYEVGEHDGLHFFTMRLVEGGSLNQRLDRYRNDYKATARLMATAARAVHYAHQRQLLHRDLKPGNILLDAAGQPHVADFGLAKRMGEGGEASQSQGAGTPEYMAPEQARGEKRLTTAADVYALGGVLYALLAGRPPFRGDTPLATMEKVRNEEPAPPSKVRPGVPRDLETICLKCLQKEPAKRYGSAEALVEDLERWLKGEPVKGRPVGRMERAWLWCWRNPAAAGLSAAFVTALLIGAAVSTYFAITSNANYQEARRREKDANDQKEQVSKANIQLEDQKQQLAKTNGQLEESVARGLLRPLCGSPGGSLTSPEIDAVWELGSNNERVRLSFIEQVLQRSQKARRFWIPDDLAIHAAVGLSPIQRQKVEDILAARMRDGPDDFGVRLSCVFIGVGLDDWTPEFAGTAARQAIDLMAKTKNPFIVPRLAQALATLAPRLEPAPAAAAGRLAVDLMANTNDPETMIKMAQALATLAPRLEAIEASRQTSAAACLAVDAMAKTSDPGTLNVLAQALAALAPRLETREASAAARQVVAAMAKTPYLTPRAQALAALASQLDPVEASAIVRQALEALPRTEDPYTLWDLTTVVAELTPWLEPAEASRQTSAAARQTLDAMVKTNDAGELYYLALALKAMAPRLEPTTAAAAARQVLDVMAKTKDQRLRANMAMLALAALAPRLEAAEAAVATCQALDEMTNMRDELSVADMAKAVVALAPRLEPADAAAAARQAMDVMAKTNSPRVQAEMPHELAALASRLESVQASAVARQALDVMAKTNDPRTLESLAQALAALAPRLEPAAASAAARQAVERMKTNGPGVLVWDALVWAALAPWLEPVEASAAARATIETMAQAHGNDPNLPLLSDALAALIVHTSPGEASRRIYCTTRVVGNASSPPAFLAGLGWLTEVSQPLPGRFSEQQLIELLKMPTCAHETRQVIVRQLGVQCGQTFATQWEFVAWAHDHRPDLDLTSPPVRPDAP